MAEDDGDYVEGDLHVPAHQIDHRWTTSLGGNVDHLYAGLEVKHLPREVLHRAVSDRGEVDLVRTLLGEDDQLLDALDRQRGMADHQLRADGDQADRGEIADRIIG